MRSFYELKYRVIETFYDVLYEEGYSFCQAADRSYYEFTQEVKNKDLESIIVVVTIGLRLLKHKSITEYHLNIIKEAISLYVNSEFDFQLSKDDLEVLSEEVEELKKELRI